MKINDKNFLFTFGALILLLGALLIYLHQMPIFGKFSQLNWVGLGMYSLITMWVYLMAKYYTSKSMDVKYANLIYLNTIVKFLATIILPVIFYFQYNKPRGTFILPFLLIYILFTVYSTWLLNKMAVMRK